MPAARLERLVDELVDEVAGLGPLEPWLADPDVTEVMLNGPGRAFVERRGVLEAVELGLDAPAIVQLVERVVAPLGLRLDRASPMVDAASPRRLAAARGDPAARDRRPVRHHPPLRYPTPGAGRVRRRSGAGRVPRLGGRRGLEPARRGRHQRGEDHAAQHARPRDPARRAGRHHRGDGRAPARARARRAARGPSGQRRGCGRGGGARPRARRAADATRPAGRRRGARCRGARHAPGDQHRPRRVAVHHPRQRSRRRPAPARDPRAPRSERAATRCGARPDRGERRRGRVRRSPRRRGAAGRGDRRGGRRRRPRRADRRWRCSSPGTTVRSAPRAPSPTRSARVPEGSRAPRQGGSGDHRAARGGGRRGLRGAGRRRPSRRRRGARPAAAVEAVADPAGAALAPGRRARGRRRRHHTRGRGPVRARSASPRARSSPSPSRPRSWCRSSWRRSSRGPCGCASRRSVTSVGSCARSRTRSNRSGASCAAAGASPARSSTWRSRRRRSHATRGVCTHVPRSAWHSPTRSRCGRRSTTPLASVPRPARSPWRRRWAGGRPTRSTVSRRRCATGSTRPRRRTRSRPRPGCRRSSSAPHRSATSCSPPLVDARSVTALVGTGVGRVCLVVGLALEALAAVWMRRIVASEPT